MKAYTSLLEERYRKVQKSIDTYIITRCSSFYELAAPLFVGWEVTSRCNLRCRHCRAADNISKRKKGELTLGECKAVIDQLSRAQVYTVGITGGEPFLRQDIFEIIRYCKEKGLQLIIYTNATMISSHLARKLGGILDKHDIMHVSLDSSNANTHNQIRGMDCFHKTINGIKNLSENGLTIRLNVVPTRLNMDSIFGIIDIAEKYHVKYFSGSPLMTISRGRNKDLIPDPKVMYALEKKIYERMKTSPVEFEGGISGAICTMYPFREQISKEFPNREQPLKRLCDAGTRKLFIDATGDCYPCSLFALNSNLCMGNILRNSVEDIWKNRKMNFLRNGVKKNKKVCDGCELWDICDGGCMALSLDHFGDLTIPDPRCMRTREFVEGGNC